MLLIMTTAEKQRKSRPFSSCDAGPDMQRNLRKLLLRRARTQRCTGRQAFPNQAKEAAR